MVFQRKQIWKEREERIDRQWLAGGACDRRIGVPIVIEESVRIFPASNHIEKSKSDR